MSTTPDHTESLKKAVINLLNSRNQALNKNQIAKILSVKGDKRIQLKVILKNLKKEGYAHIISQKKEQSSPALHKRTVPFFKKKKILPQQNTSYVGIFTNQNGRGFLAPCHRKDPFPDMQFDIGNMSDIPNEYVVIYQIKTNNQVHIEKIIGSIHDPKIYSLIAIHSHKLPFSFSSEALNLAKKHKGSALQNRTDFRKLPLVTIDGQDAKDFDDAVWAEPDNDSRNTGGWRIIVAIADVAYYVRPNDALDREAYIRGNSTYFPDQVVPMLPEALSNELCSLKPNQDRACLAVEMIINKEGKIKSHRFKRGLMRSAARLTYDQVHCAIQGKFDEITRPLWPQVLKSLYGAYCSFINARQKRGTLDLNIPERKIIFDHKNSITHISIKDRFESHQIIEELMIAANVCAGHTLISKKYDTLHRVHDLPAAGGVENLKHVLKGLRLPIPKTKTFTPTAFQNILKSVNNTPYKHLVNELVLRSQSQANYSPHNIGHFGLGLIHYCHFTSPIRRYSDLVVHRNLISALNLGEGGHIYDLASLESIGVHLSITERTSALAEREANDRFITAFLQNHRGETFTGTIVGITSMGIFISLDQNGGQGFIPKHHLPNDYYIFDSERHQYLGQRTKKIYQLGQSVTVKLEAADPTLCSTTFSLVKENQLQQKIKKNKYSRKK